MAKSAAVRRREIRLKARKKKQQQKYIQLGLMGLGVVLVIFSIVMAWPGRGTQTLGSDYRPEDVVYAQPITAIHEMEGSKLDEIPFLPKDGPQPQIAFSETFYSFGLIGPKDIVNYEFAIFNPGEAPLTISRAYTTCGCTTADFTATVIPPGKVSLMTFSLDAGYHDVSGQSIRRGVIIESNDPDNPETEVWTQANVANQ
jgi:hypothetical protein